MTEHEAGHDAGHEAGHAPAHKVVVIGGGYAGVMAANRLTQRRDIAVTVINPRPEFVARLRLHQLVGGGAEPLTDYAGALAARARLAVGTVRRIDAAGRGVTLEDGSILSYDYLIYAVGSRGADRHLPGADEFAYPMATLEAARRVRAAIDAAPANAPLTVVGAGPTGIETAAELAEHGRPVTLVCGDALGPYLHPRARRHAARHLARLGATVLDGPDARVTEVTRDAVRLADGRELPSAVTIWTAGFGVPDLAARSGLRTDAVGRLLADETLTSVDDTRIVAAGDAAAPSDLPFRMSSYTAYCLGAHAADTVLARIAGSRPEPVNLSFPAMCVSLGQRAGIYQLGHRDETARRVWVGGRTGAKIKRATYTAGGKHLAREARKPGALRWLGDNKQQLAARIARGRSLVTTDRSTTA